ncbi:MAG: hypothetical protein K0M49_02400 [Arenimonas sp.]|nr:secretion activator protein [Rhizobium sp.]MBW8444458.1 hypothetical protein [Arenimonas sp.]
MADRFSICHNITETWEGGWSDHKADPGGKTMYGITEAVYHGWLKVRGLPLRPVRNISRSEARSIYREQYWKPTAEAFALFPGVDLAVYDAAVNSGVSRGIKWLKASVGSNDHSVTVKRICRARLSFMQSLKIWQSFGRGWGRRVADIEAKGVVMAVTAMGASKKSIDHIVSKETEDALTSAKKNDLGAKSSTIGAGASSGSPLAVGIEPDDVAVFTVGAVIVVLVIATLVFIARKRAAEARAAAYAAVSLEERA